MASLKGRKSFHSYQGIIEKRIFFNIRIKIIFDADEKSHSGTAFIIQFEITVGQMVHRILAREAILHGYAAK